ncbi:sialidase family protein [Aestuariimicrobium soli]|uniref:sialidase family protein n=1 Tax=Aestuariimicrobium soli TaxID=2035834 RepID=UPI003EC130BD
MLQLSEETVIVRAGDPHPGSADPHPRVRIPAVAVLASGRILLAHDVRPSHNHDLPGPIDIVVRHSDDLGHGWSEPRLVRPHVDRADDGHPRGYGDPSLTVDPATGRVFCWYVGAGDRSFWDAEAGPDGRGQELWCSTSDDEGLTWTHRELTRALKPADIGGMFASSGNGAVVTGGPHDGRLLQPLVMRSAETGEHFTAAAISDDHGDTWTLGERVGPDCDETKLLGLASGEVLLHSRATPLRRTARSSDGGTTFSPALPDQALSDPACNGGLALWGETVVSTLVKHPNRRVGIVLRFSDDDGVTWSEPVTVTDDPAAYSVAAALPDGSLLIVWEGGHCDDLRMVTVRR